MSTKQRKFAVAALLLFTSAALAWLEAGKILHAHRLVVVDHPIRLEAGLSFTYPFTVDVAANYQIELTCARSVPAAVLDQALSKGLLADYAVSTGNDRVADGDTSQVVMPRNGASDTVSRFVGKFAAQPGHRYLLRIQFSRSLPVLAATQPTVQVSLDPAVAGPVYARAQFASLLALLFAALGLGCLPLAFARSFFRRRADPG